LLISGANGNTVTANLIGTDKTGASAVGNVFNGVIATGATTGNNTLGAGNVISGNTTNGVRLRTDCSGNVVVGIAIGVNAQITAALPNGAEGVQLNDGAHANTVGGSGADRNVISGNADNGVLIVDDTTNGNLIQ